VTRGLADGETEIEFVTDTERVWVFTVEPEPLLHAVTDVV